MVHPSGNLHRNTSLVQQGTRSVPRLGFSPSDTLMRGMMGIILGKNYKRVTYFQSQSFLRAITHWVNPTSFQRKVIFKEQMLCQRSPSNAASTSSCVNESAHTSVQLHTLWAARAVSIPEHQKRVTDVLPCHSPLNIVSQSLTESGARLAASSRSVSGTHSPGFTAFERGFCGFELRPSCLCTKCSYPLRDLPRSATLNSRAVFFHTLVHSLLT